MIKGARVFMSIALAVTAAAISGCGSTTDAPVPTATPTAVATATPTIKPLIGPVVTFIGLARADDTLVDPIGVTPWGAPIYFRQGGSGFSIVVEGKPGPTGAALALSTYQADLSSFPALQIIVSRPLGNGSEAVCDDGRGDPPVFGGIPATDPPNFDPTTEHIRHVNDLACRFLDGGGQRNGRTSSDDACVRFAPTLDYHFVDPETTAEFCGAINGKTNFYPGDTLVSARLIDIDGNVGAAAQMVVRVGG